MNEWMRGSPKPVLLSIVEKCFSSLRLFSVAVDEAHHLWLCISGDGWQTGGPQSPVRALQIIVNYGKDTYSEVLCLGDFLGRRLRSWGQTPKRRKDKEYAIYILSLLALESYVLGTLVAWCDFFFRFWPNPSNFLLIGLFSINHKNGLDQTRGILLYTFAY